MNVLALGGARGTVTMTNLKPDHHFFRFFENSKEKNLKKTNFCFDTKTEFWIKWFYFQVYSSQGSTDTREYPEVCFR